MAKKRYTVEAKVTCTFTRIYTAIAESEEEAFENIEDGNYERVDETDEDEDTPYDFEVIDEEEIDDDTE